MNSLTGFLYARPSMVEGLAHLVDFGDTLQIYNSALTPEQADYLALSSDWYVVDDDLRAAIASYKDLQLKISHQLLAEALAEVLAGFEALSSVK